MELVYFVILVSSLIFVHELGHFLFAKAFGVKVLTFSLGFGPKLLRLRGRETEYALSLFPLGGYVKMLEESRSDPVLPEDRKRTFERLPWHKRITVVLAGPLMNLLFPVLLYFAIFAMEGPFAPPTVGVVLPERSAFGLLEPGDRIMSVSGYEVGTFEEVRRIIEQNPGKTLSLKVFRANRHVTVEVPVEEQKRTLAMDLTERYGTIGIQPNSPLAVIGIASPESPAFRAGLRTFDVVTFVAGKPIRRYQDLVSELESSRGETVPVTYLRPTRVQQAMGGLADLAVYEAGVVALTPAPSGGNLLEQTGIELADLFVASVPPQSYLWKAGIRPGDRLVALDGRTLPAWGTFVDRLVQNPDVAHRLEFVAARDGRTHSGTFHVRREDFRTKSGESFSRYIFPCGSWAHLAEAGQSSCAPDTVQQWLPLALEDRVDHPSPLRYAFTKAVSQTVRVTKFIFVTFVRMAQGRVKMSDLSGPISIYEIAGEEGKKGPDYFVWVMAVISINLGLLNLFPIPALDGGHLLLYLVEALMRRPLPMRVREMLHIIGMALLIGLMGFALKNDLEKRFPSLQRRASTSAERIPR